MENYKLVGNVYKPILKVEDEQVSEIHQFKRYKQAKMQVEHLEAILKATGLALRALKLFIVYKPVYEMVMEMESQKTILEIHLKNEKEIVKRKGKLK